MKEISTKKNKLLKPSPKTFTQILLQWYAKHGRDLPWRKTKDPYAIWVSEIMLQQTQVERVKEYYQRFLQRFPQINTLAQAEWAQVLEQWRGLGYYRRARHLHAAAQLVLNDHAGTIPDDYQTLRKLPGIGAYTAGAIASFAFGQDIPAIDTNVDEVFAHVFGSDFWSSLKPQERYHFVESFIPKKQSANFHHALMDLGTALKTYLRTNHADCPFWTYCKTVNLEPHLLKPPLFSKVAVKKQSQSSHNTAIKVAIGIVVDNSKILITQRKPDVPFGSYWEFPGGKHEAGESARACLKREMQEELGIEVSVRPPFYTTEYSYDDKHYVFTFHRCSLLLGQIKLRQVAAYKWVKAEDLFHYQFPPANTKVLQILMERKGMLRG